MKSEIINIKDLTDKIEKQYENFILSKVNDHCVRVAVFEGTYEWHFHPDSEESFLVLEGELIIEVENLPKSIVLQSNDFYTIPAGVVHRTLSKCRTVNLCFEKTEATTTFVKVN